MSEAIPVYTISEDFLRVLILGSMSLSMFFLILLIYFLVREIRQGKLW
ncbi:hypothetical protein L0222_10105 [bacterium]|nr:hypothetical protein [bacterium]MCI0604617.1 hypothetical protein [bacterium]